MHYETLKHTGELPIVGVNTFLDEKGSPTIIPQEVIRSTEAERLYAIDSKLAFQDYNAEMGAARLGDLKRVSLEHGNVFEALMESCKVCSLGQMSQALYEVGGQYRRNM